MEFSLRNLLRYRQPRWISPCQPYKAPTTNFSLRGPWETLWPIFVAGSSQLEQLATFSARVTGIQILDDGFYYGIDSASDSVKYLSSQPQTSAALTSATTMVSDESSAFYALSPTEVYYAQGNLLWKNGNSVNVGATIKGLTAQTVNGQKKVYAAVCEGVVIYNDNAGVLEAPQSWSYPGYSVLYVTAIPAAPSCADSKLNQDETDVDCGGVCGATCADSKKCVDDGDCLNDYCDSTKLCGKFS